MRLPSRSLTLALAALLVAAPLGLAACSSGVEADGAINEQVTDAVSEEPTLAKEAGNLGTRLCIRNLTDREASVSFTRRDTGDDGTLAKGGVRCGEGTFAVGTDVEAAVTWDDPAAMLTITGRNPWMGAPSATLADRAPDGSYRCQGREFTVGTSVSGDNGVFTVVLTRLPDDNWKEFALELRPPANPDQGRGPMQGGGFTSCNTPAAPAAA